MSRCEGVKSTGVPSREELNRVGYPSEARVRRGRVAVLECVEEIPCNPCVEACPFGAITIEGSLCEIPRLDEDRCTGCGSCIASCPGQAIFVVGPAPGEGHGVVAFPYEFLPLPETGMEVDAVDRLGKVVCRAKVLRVDVSPRNDRTAVVYLEVPFDLVHEVRSMKRGHA